VRVKIKNPEQGINLYMEYFRFEQHGKHAFKNKDGGYTIMNFKEGKLEG